MSTQWSPGFENTYHGITVDQRSEEMLQPPHGNMSPGLCNRPIQVLRKATRLHSRSRTQTTTIWLHECGEQRIVRLDNRPLHWVDPEQTVLDTKGMYLERLKGRPSPLRPAQ